VIHRGLAAHSNNPQLRDRKQTNIPIDLLRETMLGGRTSDNRVHDAAAYRTPVMGSAKVFVVDEAERLDLPGQNALLKTLEEPPPATYLFLITSRPERLLPTILSRCQHLRLAPLTDTQMLEWFNQSDIDATPVALETAMTFAQGSPGMASLVITRDMTKWIESVDVVESWTESVVKDNPKASKDAANRDGFEMLLRVLASHLRHSLRTTDNRSTMVEHCWRVDRIAQAEAQIAAGLNLKHVLEALVAEWSCPVVH
jgi:DNA polymerase-3 subunit delta'